VFLGLSATIGFLAEFLGVNYGVGFGGSYVYRDQLGMLWGVPLKVPVYWAIFIYTSFVISSSSFGWFGIARPRLSRHSGIRAILTLLLLVLLDGLLTMNIDMALDPVQTIRESWVWKTTGPYFGIPIGNFIGWFVVAGLSTGIFRCIESLFPQEDEKVNDSTLLLPTIGYGLLAVTIILMALQLRHPEFALIAVTAMIPVVVTNTILFLASRNQFIASSDPLRNRTDQRSRRPMRKSTQ